MVFEIQKSQVPIGQSKEKMAMGPQVMATAIPHPKENQ